ncbi:hypothetical protein B0H67DRAFT_604440 [Lasiosphaeris hirsuta]|uniref:DUF7727 domain-containing protein n=1 Tax=Lasiosphaeris hirsuta TaxID=260670 RepID=A0AA40DK05_9PEZI|nr:hypothetical protein B0H67DRAFT_604440 [Lasiosphaeris hirsuta]
MGKTIWSHWARLITITAASYHVLAVIECYIWPKIFWDFLTKALDPLVKPAPVLQTVSLLASLVILALEWPLDSIAGSRVHRSIAFRLAILPTMALLGILLYQATNAAVYYMIAECMYISAYRRREVITVHPWASDE